MSIETEALQEVVLPPYFEPREPTVSMWTVYDRPRDYPDHVVVRRCYVGAGVVMHSAECELFANVEHARESLALRGLTCIGREPGDEPQIVEAWL
jgi:hypothetical protein